jgi:hypothetical protein
MSSCPILIGPDAGNTLVCSRRKKEILDFRAKILNNPVAWLNGWMFEILLFHPGCIDILFKGCDPEEVLLAIDCDFDVENMTVSIPFEDKADEFVRLAAQDGFTLDLSSFQLDSPEEALPGEANPPPGEQTNEQSPPRPECKHSEMPSPSASV